jgi:undecaprenyl diphosphate synthase
MLPAHLAIIMDGNGRWAAQRGRPRWMGHARGAHTAREVVEHCARRGIAQVTLYAFSSDNFKRPREEVGFLFQLFASHLDRHVGELVTHGIRLSIIGRRDRLPPALVAAFAEAERRTAAGTRMHLRVAVDYSSRAALAAALGGEGTPPAPLLPDVDLLLRTGGERRLSDFLLWECAYAELAFLDVLFPDLSTADVDAALAHFATRERRFGDVGAGTPAAAAAPRPVAPAGAGDPA